MNRKLTDQQIEAVCRELLESRRRAGVRTVMAELRRRHTAAGRTARVSQLLRKVEDTISVVRPAGEGGADLAKFQAQLRLAEERAARAEELERRHQDFWAARYAEKVVELEKRHTVVAAQRERPVISADQYLRIHQRAAELARRLAEYEPVEPVIAPPLEIR